MICKLEDFEIFSKRRHVTHTLFKSIEAEDKHLLQTLPSSGKFTLLVGGNTVANKKYYRNTISTKKIRENS